LICGDRLFRFDPFWRDGTLVVRPVMMNVATSCSPRSHHTLKLLVAVARSPRGITWSAARSVAQNS
jgi:hypothetical protein